MSARVLGDATRMANVQTLETTRVVCPPTGGRRRGRRGRKGGRSVDAEPPVTVTLSDGSILSHGAGSDDGQKGTNTQPEVCRNYLNGRCANSRCPRLHEPAGIPQTAGKGSKRGKGDSTGSICVKSGQDSEDNVDGKDGGKDGPAENKGAKAKSKNGTKDKGDSKKQSKASGKDTIQGNTSSLRPRLIKGGNTKSFKPSHSPPDMRVVIGSRGEKFGRTFGVHDVVMVPELFCDAGDTSVYETLLSEIKAAGQDSLWASWHGDSHMIADDKRMGGKWKDMSPTFMKVVDKIRTYFNMDIQATRFNWYRDSSDWKPYHHDAAAMKAHMATKQNVTIAASFGAERDVSFMVRFNALLTALATAIWQTAPRSSQTYVAQHAKTKVTTDMPQPNGCAYAFGRDLNLDWQHGILQLPLEEQTQEGARISIIAWGWVDQLNDDGIVLKKGMY